MLANTLLQAVFFLIVVELIAGSNVFPALIKIQQNDLDLNRSVY